MKKYIMIIAILIFSAILTFGQKQFTQGVITPTITGSNVNDSLADHNTKIQAMYNDTASWRNKVIILKMFQDTGTVHVNDSILFTIPSEYNNYYIYSVRAAIYTASSSGTPTFQIGRGTRATPSSALSYNTVLSTLITIDANEYSSNNAATPPVINGTYKTVATDNVLKAYCTVAGTGTKGGEIKITLRKP